MDVNLCTLLFTLMTTSTLILGLLLNLCESYLPILITRTFRYGKFACKEDSPLIRKFELPKSYFRHFYLTAALIYYPITFYQVLWVYVFGGEVSQWLKIILDITCGSNRLATVSATQVFIAVTLMVLQVFRRFFDTHCISVFSKSATINLSHYIIGLVFYPGVALIMLSQAPNFGAVITSVNDNTRVQLQNIGVVEITAIVLFLWAWYHQHVTTVILANLRKNETGQVVSQKYKIPEGDWFNYLSSPHSSAEILMYTALTLLLYRSSNWWYVYVWVLTNQIETILLSHWWYKSHFKNFPKQRKALIPFVY